MMVRAWWGLLSLGLVLLHSGSAHAERPRTPLAKRPLLPVAGPSRIVVKFVDAARLRGSGSGALRSDTGRDLASLRTLLADRGLSLSPVFSDATAVTRLTERARRRSGRAQADLLGMYEVGGASIEDARALQALDIVEFVSIRSTAVPPPLDIAPPTPDLVDFQTYLGPEQGVDAIGAWAMGYRGENVRLSDVEYAWFYDHEEWNEGTMIPEPNQTVDLEAIAEITDGNHGTAVAGQLIGGDNGYGVTGIAPDSVLGVYPERTIESGSRRPEAIVSAGADSEEGDVILLEMQTSDVATGLLGPAELFEPVWLATQTVTDAGVVVVAAAGNGGLDLDREELAFYRERGDSGAIMVGAGEPGTRERLSFSTYGERVDVQGWGQQVFTTGYGQHASYGDDANQSYTASFGGTSSASPIVAGVAALVQDAVKAEGGQPLTSTQMRTILQGTGLPQPMGDTGLIGPLPQAPAAIAAALLPPAAPTVTIATPTSTQTEDETFTTVIEVAASDDTAFVQLTINGELQPVVDDVPPFAFAEVIFPVGTWEVAAVATNVWDIEGTSDAVVLEVGYTPPETTSGADDSSGGIDAGTGSETGVDESTTGTSTTSPPEPDTTSGADGSSSGGDGGAAGSDGGCRTGGGAPPLLLLLGLLAIWRTRGPA